MKSSLPVAFTLLAISQIAASGQGTDPSAASSGQSHIQTSGGVSTPATNYGKLPLSFEGNQGQTDSQVRFLSRGQGYSLFLTDTSAVLALTKRDPASPKLDRLHGQLRNVPAKAKAAETDVVRMELAGVAHGLRVDGADPLPGKNNYFLSSDRTKWRTDVPTYAKVKYSGVYPGVDLVYYGNHQQLEFDFVVAPLADVKPVRLHFEGAEKLQIDADGNLTIRAKNGEVAFHKPVVYQLKGGQREAVDGRFKLLTTNDVGFDLSQYDHSRELVIDPTLAYSTYFGGSGFTELEAPITADAIGNVYAAGITYSTDFPAQSGALGGSLSRKSGVIFVTKVNQAGSAIDYTAFFPSDGGTYPSALAIDPASNVYVTGGASAGFPTTAGAYQECPNVESYFVLKLNATGNALDYSTCFTAQINGVAVDGAGNAYLTGLANGQFYPPSYVPTTPGAFQTAAKNNGANSAFVTKLNPEGTNLLYSTYLGGSPVKGADYRGDYGLAITVDGVGHAFVCGGTSGTHFPTTPGALQTTNRAVSTGASYSGQNAFVSKFNLTGTELIYSTYLGGSASFIAQSLLSGDVAHAIAVDQQGYAYVAGDAVSTDFPVTSTAFQKVNDGTVVGFVSKLNPAGTALAYSTYLGGSEFAPKSSLIGAHIDDLGIDAQGDAFVTGFTTATNFPVTPDAFQSVNHSSGGNVYLTGLNPTGSSLVYSTYLGGSASGYDGDSRYGVGIDGLGNVYLGAFAISNDFPITKGVLETEPGVAFLAKFALHGATTTTLSSSSNPAPAGRSVTLTAAVAPVDGTGTPTGLVSFIVDGVNVAHVPLDGSGTAAYETSSLVVGTHLVSASYLGDPKAYSSSGDGLTENITGQIAAPTFPKLGGTYITPLSVAIESSSPGAVIHYTTDGTPPTSSSAIYKSPFSIVSTTTVKAIAVESGDTQSAVATATYTIAPGSIATTTTLTSSSNPSTVGESVKFTATVTAASGPPTGSVSFKNGSVIVGTAPLVHGVASFSISGLTPDAHAIAAIYTGSATDAASGMGITQEVNQ
ncbi:Cell surface protein [Acidisarcina polymorpha]|uniref:Cell surface protein n=1 Tax=Acidisarcina polymorpha TaxID=2211140 RepID=A0A2Z5G2Q4_9BACT|nr:Ig-like domain repeat protein [Acidisarcina polymorpha]AXC12915.1 Cell surface protein [Acidisarcina polymorpha]